MTMSPPAIKNCTAASGAGVLVVIAPAEAPVVARTFDSFRLIRTVRIPIGGNSARVTQFYDAQGYKGPQHWP